MNAVTAALHDKVAQLRSRPRADAASFSAVVDNDAPSPMQRPSFRCWLFSFSETHRLFRGQQNNGSHGTRSSQTHAMYYDQDNKAESRQLLPEGRGLLVRRRAVDSRLMQHLPLLT